GLRRRAVGAECAPRPARARRKTAHPDRYSQRTAAHAVPTDRNRVRAAGNRRVSVRPPDRPVRLGFGVMVERNEGKGVAESHAEGPVRSNVFRRLYDWVLSWAETRHGPAALGALSFAESSFFPVPPDPLLMA